MYVWVSVDYLLHTAEASQLDLVLSSEGTCMCTYLARFLF